MVTVSKEITRLEHSAVKLTLTVARDEVRSAYDALTAEYAKSIQIPGFRKGKTPRAILERKFGDALKSEALGRILEDATAEAFQDETAVPPEIRPLPYSNPRIDAPPALDFEADMVFSLTYDAMPAITLGQWRGIEIEVPEVQAGDSDIQAELEIIRERNAVVQDKDDSEPAENGDVVSVNYTELDPQGTPIPETERQDFVFTLGTGRNLFNFDDEVLGMKKGEAKQFAKTLPEDFTEKAYAGKTVSLNLSVNSIKKKELPVLDDEFAQDVDEKYKTLEDLKNSIRERLNKEIGQKLRGFKINRIMEKIMEQSPVDLPESMIEFQMDRHWQRLAQRLNTSADALKAAAQDEQSPVSAMVATWRPEVIRALHSGLVLEALVKELNIAVSGEDVTAHVEKLAQSSGMPLEEMRKYYEQGEARQYLEEEVKEDRAYAAILEASKITPGKAVPYREFAENNG
ncbi:MAG: trigger factor [Spirochaetaceae bacterium]|jgi:trigger factor|nr:trigger factor [Spirochaetaceae bacterium]